MFLEQLNWSPAELQKQQMLDGPTAAGAQEPKTWKDGEGNPRPSFGSRDAGGITKITPTSTEQCS